MLIRHRGVHLGVATQTPDGLKVPVVRHAEARSLWDLAAEIRRVSEAARTGKAAREELTGSTITITSLGRLGGIVSTPIINAPEMAIIGVNKAVERPVVAERRGHRAPHHEPVLVVRSPFRRRLRRRGDDPGAQGPARAPGNDLHPGLVRCTPSNPIDSSRPLAHEPESPGAPGLRHGAGRPDGGRDVPRRQVERHEIRPTGPIEIHPAAHVLHYASTCFEGFKAYRWADGSVRVFRMDKHIERLRQSATPARAAGAGRGAARAHDPGRDRPRARAGARSRRARCTCGRCCSAPCRTSARPRALERGDADRAREPGVGLLLRRREAAAHLRRGREASHRRSPRHGQDRRQLRGGHGSDARRARQVQGRPGAVLPGRLGAGNRCRELPADPRGTHPDAQPRLDLPARRDARLAAHHGAGDGIQGRGARVRRRRDAGVGQDRRGCALGHGGRAGGRRHAGARADTSTRSATAKSGP